MLTKTDDLMKNLNARQRQVLAGRSPNELSPEELLDLHNLQSQPLATPEPGDFKLDPAKFADLDPFQKLEAANAEALINRVRRRVRSLQAQFATASDEERASITRSIADQKNELQDVWPTWKDKGCDVAR